MEYWVNVVLLFFVYGFAGWCMEVILKYRQYHRFINRGFLTGPICPIYGWRDMPSQHPPPRSGHSRPVASLLPLRYSQTEEPV